MIDMIHESIISGLVLLLRISFILSVSFISMNLTIPTNCKGNPHAMSLARHVFFFFFFECFVNVSGIYYHPFFLVL